MELNCKLVKKTFTADDGSARDYFVLQFKLIDGSTLDVSLKGDKAKLLVLSANLDKEKEPKMPELDW